MGGGGGGTWTSSGNVSAKAGQALEQASKRRNLFISFDFDDARNVNLLRADAKNENKDIEFIDRSLRKAVDSENDSYIQQRISEKIRQCSMTIVYLSENSGNSTWVNWEIERSIALGKSVIGVYDGDSCPKNLPKAFKENGFKAVSRSNLSNQIEPE